MDKKTVRALVHYLFLILMVSGSILSLYFVNDLNNELTSFQTNYSINKFKGLFFLQLFWDLQMS